MRIIYIVLAMLVVRAVLWFKVNEQRNHAHGKNNLYFEVSDTELYNGKLFYSVWVQCRPNDAACITPAKQEYIIDAVVKQYNLSSREDLYIVWDGFAPVPGSTWTITTTMEDNGLVRYYGKSTGSPKNLVSNPGSPVIRCNKGKYDANLIYQLATVKSGVGDRWKVVVYTDATKKKRTTDYCSPWVFLSQ